MPRKRILAALPFAVLGAALFFQYLLIRLMTDGHFFYGMDDPYIHLSLAENIARGHYGINADEYAAPASSILWPFLLTPFAGSPFFFFMPLMLNILFAGLALYAVRNILRLIVGEKPFDHHAALMALALCCLIFGFNLIGLTYLGMEHMMQVWASLQLLYGLILVLEQKRCPLWLPWIILLGPLVRYENLALSGIAILFLMRQGYWKQALLSGAATLLLVGGFSVFLMTLGLSPMPSSTLVKLQYQTQSDMLILQKLLHANHVIILIFMLPLFIMARKKGAEGALMVLIALAALAHVATSAVSAYDRYEVYITAVLLLTLLYGQRKQVLEVLADTPLKAAARLTVALGGLLVVYVIASTYNVPYLSRSIYLQQYQTQRFFKEFYPVPVAVNDIGFVSLRNDRYVLDLIGLANEEGRKHIFRTPEERRQWIDAAANAHGVKAAAVYNSWVGGVLPKHWVAVASMTAEGTLGKDLMLGDKTVTFYATNAREVRALRNALTLFKGTLPKGTELTWVEKKK